MAERIGNWMQTVGGRAFYPLDPRPEDIDIEDIAHALSLVCRFGGHCSTFYSVAEHSVRVSMAIVEAGGTRTEAFAGLMHDAAEAYLGDMIWPLKQAPSVAGYKAIEHRVQSVIFAKFGLPDELPPIVKRFDLVLLSTEKRDLMIAGPGREDGAKREARAATQEIGAWHSDAFEPLPDAIKPDVVRHGESLFPRLLPRAPRPLMPIYTVTNPRSTVDLGDFADALKLYRNQRLRRAAPVIATSDPEGFTAEQDEAIDVANRETLAAR